MKHLTIKYQIITIITLWCINAQSTLFVNGNSAYPFTFTQQVTAKTYDRANGTLYVGLGGATSDAFLISKIGRAVAGTTPQFIGIGNLAGVTISSVASLAVATSLGVPARILAGQDGGVSIFALSTDGTQFAIDATVLDASGALNMPGAQITGILDLVANNSFIFATVAPSGGIFGTLNSGIAVLAINRGRLNPNKLARPTLSSITQTTAVPGDGGVKAQKLDPTSPTVVVPSASTNFPTIASTPGCLFWDDPLYRLYAGISVTSNAIAGSGARSVVVGRIFDNGDLQLIPIAPDSAITTTAGGAENEIVAGIQGDGVQFTLSANKLRVMHTSTGPSYLIVNGGNGNASVTNPKIFALPLVDTRNSQGVITNELIQGTLAAKNSALVNFKFVTPAAAPGDLVKDPTLAGTDDFALVGGAPVLNNNEGLSDIVVVGDTVYVTIDVEQSDINETGILYSQAKFGEDGRIVGWTPWSKRAFPPNGFIDPSIEGAIKFFDVDALTGSLWAIGGSSNNPVSPKNAIVVTTQWDHGISRSANLDLNNPGVSLAAQLNTLLTSGCYAVLDLDAFTRGFNSNTAERYALFGGSGQVIFTRVSESRNGTTSDASQTVEVDFSLAQNLLQTFLPQSAGCVNCLEYARRGNTGDNYFFAGTKTGLYVYAQGGTAGFNADTLSTVDQPPISSGVWVKAPNILGSVIDIKTLGNQLYILSSYSAPGRPYNSILYSVTFATSVTAMFAAPFILAQTGANSFVTTQQFAAIELIATTSDSSTEQIVLATNTGLYQSTTAGGVQAATSDATAAWLRLDSAFYRGMNGQDPAVSSGQFFDGDSSGGPHTVWPWSIADARGKGTFDRSSIHQLNGATNAGPYELIPEPFNANVTFPRFTTLPSINYFWSDGARRFFIIRRPNGCPSFGSMMVLPFNVIEWDVVNPADNILVDPTLSTVQSFYWVKQIGTTGIVMAGTNKGVVALE